MTSFENSEINPILPFGNTIDFLLDENDNFEVKISNRIEFQIEEKESGWGILSEKELYYLSKSLPLIGIYKDV